MTVSIDRLKLFYDGDLPAHVHQPPPVDANLDMAGDEFAEIIQADSDHDIDPVLPIVFPVPPAPPLPNACLLYTSPSPRDGLLSRMPSSA